MQRLVRRLGPERVARQFTAAEWAHLQYAWRVWARPEQLEPDGDWRVWLYLAGRGAGKTRTGAEWILGYAHDPRERFGLIAPTAADVRDVMVEGESGILARSPPWFRPKYSPSVRRLEWPSGAQATTYSADEPDRLRGPQHTRLWCDEVAAWRYPETFDMALLGLRLGPNPRAMATTTPRPTQLVRRLMAQSTTVVTRGSTFDNRANLPAAFLDAILGQYEGTRLGRQEIYGEMLDDTPGALFRRDDIDAARVRRPPFELVRTVISVDPAVTSTDKSDETGIIVASVGLCSCRGEEELHGFVLDDLSGKYSPHGWARKVVEAYHEYDADRIVPEVNNGGDLVEANIRTVDPMVPVRAVRASRGKRTRAEPIAALCEQGKIHHVGSLAKLEDQQCTWDPLQDTLSPDRVDAYVWAMSDLMLGHGELEFAGEGGYGQRRI